MVRNIRVLNRFLLRLLVQGRRKITIAPLKEDRNRSVTFLKRKTGLFKKAHELGVLCSADVAVIVFGNNGKLHEFSSGNIEKILMKYTEHSGETERRGPRDFTDSNENDDNDNDIEQDNEHDDNMEHHQSTHSPSVSVSARQDDKDIKPRIQVDQLGDENAHSPSPSFTQNHPAHPPQLPRSPKPISPKPLSPYPMPSSFLSPNSHTQPQHNETFMNWQFAQMQAQMMSQQQQQQQQQHQHQQQHQQRTTQPSPQQHFLSPSTHLLNPNSPNSSHPPPPFFASPNMSNMPGMPWYAPIPPVAWPPPPAPPSQLPNSMFMDPFQFPLEGFGGSSETPFQWPISNKDSSNDNSSAQNPQNPHAHKSAGSDTAASTTTTATPVKTEDDSPRPGKRTRKS
ncbi:Transcription factor SMP1 [Wallemia ichthyophaga EXF-994]|uniref:Transcription factor SMP1 n=1 Tax=Wallemia ichthyophaga (strain EXF-994 / CBS 113033) TaxID=1299270 RepID=R9AHD7_WALI9|nr:Transcription factor SMP1 [Wallemia ichthyophaga EXF-994]EOR01597.1 Transcription factor SMP1 [Wallemia ichthyophaga EXF-994]